MSSVRTEDGNQGWPNDVRYDGDEAAAEEAEAVGDNIAAGEGVTAPATAVEMVLSAATVA